MSGQWVEEQFVLNRNKAVLLLIDFQEQLAPVIDQLDEMTRKASMLLQGLAILDVPVILTEQYPRGLGNTIPALQPMLADAPVFEKMQFSAWTPQVKTWLIASQRNQVLVAGMESHICVLQTCRDLMKNNLFVFPVEDCMGSRTTDNKANAIQQMRQMGCVVTNVETALFDMLQAAGGEAFKKISKAIK